MVVMKFGGTSVADRAAIERLMAIVRAERQAGAQQEGGDARGPVVVVSALSGVTDRLLGVAAPEEYGGLDLDKAASLVVVERIARSASFGTTFGGQISTGGPLASSTVNPNPAASSSVGSGV